MFMVIPITIKTWFMIYNYFIIVANSALILIVSKSYLALIESEIDLDTQTDGHASHSNPEFT